MDLLGFEVTGLPAALIILVILVLLVLGVVALVRGTARGAKRVMHDGDTAGRR